MWKKLRRKQAPPESDVTPDASSSRRPSEQSADFEPDSLNRPLSTFAINPAAPVTKHTRVRSRDRRLDPLGLSVLHEPELSRSVDIIFVHGLGGTSRQTWMKNRELDLFWPNKWLPLEPEIRTARVLTFGYNAHFAAAGQSIMNISDFAKDLLFGMKFGKDEMTEDLKIGEVPIVFVAHSMGGLVAKEAYILGQNDASYSDMIEAISAIVFLSTPHRGSNLAEVLNRILSVSIFNHSPKQYITELNKSSPRIEQLNEQFRNVAPKLQIVSFYETLFTTVGPKKMMVVPKDSSILGYPGEISKPLNADHHDVCKYASPQDPNYVSVRNVLQTLVGRFKRSGTNKDEKDAGNDIERISTTLAVFDPPEDDYVFFRDRWMEGTCEWILSNPVFTAWRDEPTSPQILWLHALPGNGKSILSSFVINHLREEGYKPQFYFFRFGDCTKATVNSFVRSVAYQVALVVPAFRRKLRELCESSGSLEKTEARTLWRKLFTSALFKLDQPRPLYWVVDALDECDAPQSFLEILSNLSSCRIPIRVMIISRKSQQISMGFDRLGATNPVETISLKDNDADIRAYVEEELSFVYWTETFKQSLVKKILDRAHGNFLWVHLSIKEILKCHTPEDIAQALDDIPTGMESLYQRMEAGISKNVRPSDRALAKTLLTWAACPRRPLTLAELSVALEPEFPAFLDLKHTINAVCGEFIVVDNKSLVVMVHQTAREYLMKTPGIPFSINPHQAHEMLFTKSISFLMDTMMRGKLNNHTNQPFLAYAGTSWAYHLYLSPASSDKTLTLITKFLRGPYVLTWIHALALLGQLKVLAFAARTLNTFVERKARLDTEKSPNLHRTGDVETLRLWAVDFVKIIGKFGGNLLSHPESIYKLVHPFCPRNSIMFQQFGGRDKTAFALSVSGLSTPNWDDSLARLSVGAGKQALSILSTGRHIAVLTTGGTIILWDAVTFEETCRLHHQEHVFTMCFNAEDGNMLITYGFKSTKIWELPSGRKVLSFPNPAGSKALAISFTNAILMIASDDKRVRTIVPSEAASTGWKVMESNILKEDTILEGTFYNSPNCMAFNFDTTLLAVTFRGFPLSIWSIENPRLVGRLKRVADGRRKMSNAWTGVDRISWHPFNGEIMGLYNDGYIFKWNPFEDESQELSAGACEIRCSPAGDLFITGDANGNVKIWSYQHFALIYQLSSENVVTDLAFSPDSRRFYDLRGSTCNIWEPNSLIRLADTDEREGDTKSEAGSTTLASMISESWAEEVEAVSALAANPKANLYCVGNDEGVVDLFHSDSGKIKTLWKSRSSMTVDIIVWSEDGKYVALAEIGGRVVVVSVSVEQKGMCSIERLLDAKVHVDRGGFQQLLFSPDSELLLASSLETTTVWSLEKSTIITTRKNDSSCKWANSPSDPSQILCFEFSGLGIHDWESLSEIKRLQIDTEDYFTHPTTGDTDEKEVSPWSPPELKCSVDRLIMTPDKSQLIVQSSQSSSTSRSRRTVHLQVFDICSLESSAIAETSITSLAIPPFIASQIEIPYAVLGKDRFVFLNRSFWICTWRMDSGDDASAVKEHFFLPRDWLNLEHLRLGVVTEDGIFLCPRNGEVAVIRSGLGMEW